MQLSVHTFGHFLTILPVIHTGDTIMFHALKEKFLKCWNNFTQFMTNVKITNNRVLCQIRQHFTEAGNKGSKWEGAGKEHSPPCQNNWFIKWKERRRGDKRRGESPLLNMYCTSSQLALLHHGWCTQTLISKKANRELDSQLFNSVYFFPSSDKEKGALASLIPRIRPQS